MGTLNKNWKPGFGSIVTWFAADKNGYISVMVNNCWGDIPRLLLDLEGVEEKLDEFSEFMWEESTAYSEFQYDIEGETILDCYSAGTYRSCSNKREIQSLINEKPDPQFPVIREYDVPYKKGFYIYHAVEGDSPGEDYPVGYNGSTEMGDYFRYLIPTRMAYISNIPASLRGIVVVSNALDFSKDQLIPNKDINKVFANLYGKS
ncbi:MULTISPECIES: hypothetical protein [unclassified Pseudomonas]|uniref:hypothetical protein n=1 Tax=unclassified Pseudomonas TaxID=196821 RepID=UPI00257E9487|nr:MULTISPECIES: hypothetical protein [unclassified Pseudomonas]